MDKNQLILSTEYDIDNVGMIYFPMVEDLKDKAIGEDKINRYIVPYKLTKHHFQIDKDKKKNEEILRDITLFDILTFKDLPFDDNTTYIELITDSLKYYFKVDVQYNMEINSFIIDNKGIINRDNFDQIADIILAINNNKKLEIEDVPEFKNEKQRDVYYKIMAGRKRQAEKNKVTLSTIINIVIHGGNSFIPYYELLKMTIYQLINSYKAIIDIDICNRNYQQYLAGADANKIDLSHWSEKIKI